MNDFTKKQRLFKRLRNIVLIVSAVYILIYIGIEPYIVKSFGSRTPFELTVLVLVIISLVSLFLYESIFAKSEKYIEDVLITVHDSGYYYTARKETIPKEYSESVKKDLTEAGYKAADNTESKELTFDFSASKGKEYFYLVTLDSADKNDIIAYSDSALNDITAVRMRNKGNALVVFVCNRADESAVELSKNIQRVFSGKSVLKIGIAIAETETGKVYFRGNEPSVIQKLAVSYVMNCDLPIDEKYKSKEKLAFQTKAEQELKSFNLKDFNNGKYFER